MCVEGRELVLTGFVEILSCFQLSYFMWEGKVLKTGKSKQFL